MSPAVRLHRDDPPPRIDATDAAREQGGTAEAGLHDGAECWLHLPWPAIDAQVGGIGAGNVWFVGGFSGHGKTTWLMNLANRLLAEDRVVYYLGTETQGHELRTRLACQRVGVYSGDVLTGASRGWEHWLDIRASLVADIRTQIKLGTRNRFLVCPVERVGAADLTGAFHDAALSRADVLIIDHIDHLTHGAGRTGFEDSRLLAHLVLDLAQSTGIPVIAATQFNNEGLRGDRLGQYKPPQPHHVYMGGHKRQIAWGMLGLYRPVRDDLTKEQHKAASAGRMEPAEFLEPNCLAMIVMKHRHYGGHEGNRVRLRFDRGVLTDETERDRYATDHDAARRI